MKKTCILTTTCFGLTLGLGSLVANAQVINEGFEDITTLPGAGWSQINHSGTVGLTGWFQGNSGVFPAQAGSVGSYIGANFNNTTGTNTISNWLLTPPETLQNGTVLKFWTRTVPTVAYP